MAIAGVHDDIYELLPWLVNGSLSDKEQLRVTSHLRGCEICRAERDHLQRLQAVISEDEGSQPDYRPSFVKLEARINLAEANRSSIEDLLPTRERSRWSIGGISGRSWYAGFGIAASLMVGYLAGIGGVGPGGVGSVGVGPDGMGMSRVGTSEIGPAGAYDSGQVSGLDFSLITEPVEALSAPSLQSLADSGLSIAGDEYVTLTSTSMGMNEPDGILHRVYLTFDQPVQAETIRAALIDTRSRIVSGPDQVGTYTVNIRVPPSVTDVEFLESIRQIDGVRYAAFTQSSGTQSDR